MGDFRIIIDTVGGHGQDRTKKSGETVDFGGETTPEGYFKKCIEEAIAKGIISSSDTKAKVIHWPLDNYGGQLQNERSNQIVDDLITGKRVGSF